MDFLIVNEEYVVTTEFGRRSLIVMAVSGFACIVARIFH
jgi:hypothetical protein